MTFCEVAFELSDARHPLCRLTRAPGVHVVYRVLDTGEIHRRHRAHLMLRGPPDAGSELVRELKLAHPLALVEVLHQSGQSSGVLIETPVDPSGPSGLAALPGVLAHHGLPAVLDPIVAHQGRVRVRFVVARPSEPQEVLRALQDMPRATGFGEFRIQRIGPLAPGAHVEAARRSLPAEQESLLALAASMGYYSTPKAVTLEEIARAVGLSISPVHKRLKAAEETIVAQHVAPAPQPAARRRPREPTARALPAGLWEIVLRVRGDVGPASFLAGVPHARASLHVLAHDGSRLQSSILVVIAPEEAQAKLLAALEDRPEVAQVGVIERGPGHVACRLQTRERGAYALGWWTDTWGQDAVLRSLVFENGETHLRALLCRPQAHEGLDARLQATAHAAGWAGFDLVALRSLEGGAPPASWPEPLTQRQLEVLRVAHALGYYRTPRECTLEHVAKTLGVSANAIHKNLVLAEGKLIAAYLAGGL